MFEKKTLQLLQLFYRETERVRLFDVNQLPPLDLELQQVMNQWLETKRNFQLDEICEQYWIKTCSAGYITELRLHANGTLDEYTLFNRLHTQGHWQLVDGVIEIEIIKGDNRYRCAVYANRYVSIHSAIEYKNDELHSYLKLAQTRPI
ncbi:hypothetical protein C0Z01_03535 [Photobacterium kishitanii]|uniref:Uncharacterized protein n=1 Tax=Photobacterium kishitanii TaxID=318456 RepID=A0A2T3KKK5_9GAMM|nr:hypothetical protein [Photobacterium kishitanii]KJG09719.1 hypothetical protein UB40_10900 [Photobacterium kishitanii]KJG57932.1 hypothetical protein UA38_08640 [Photobacterium kishitanii]KJG61508.1 hypothetical protein UA42_10085 [Photobacterium kishitanii]KJG66319.1 hypothetical protein UA40_08360 [Photobacterium kishitanii]KJG69597.1 hypothetical protein UA41_10095 [Photobacterium kishitanii]